MDRSATNIAKCQTGFIDFIEKYRAFKRIDASLQRLQEETWASQQDQEEMRRETQALLEAARAGRHLPKR